MTSTDQAATPTAPSANAFSIPGSHPNSRASLAKEGRLMFLMPVRHHLLPPPPRPRLEETVDTPRVATRKRGVGKAGREDGAWL